MEKLPKTCYLNYVKKTVVVYQSCQYNQWNLEINIIIYGCFSDIRKYLFLKTTLMSLNNFGINTGKMFRFLVLCKWEDKLEPKAEVYYCDHALSVVRPSVCRLSVVNFSHFRLLLLKPLNRIQRNLTGSKNYQVCVFLVDRKNKIAALAIGWDIFNFSEMAERNSMKFDRKQDLNVFYQVCAFRADRKNKMAALSSDWLIHFRLLLWNNWTELNETW